MTTNHSRFLLSSSAYTEPVTWICWKISSSVSGRLGRVDTNNTLLQFSYSYDLSLQAGAGNDNELVFKKHAWCAISINIRWSYYVRDWHTNFMIWRDYTEDLSSVWRCTHSRNSVTSSTNVAYAKTVTERFWCDDVCTKNFYSDLSLIHIEIYNCVIGHHRSVWDRLHENAFLVFVPPLLAYLLIVFNDR